MSNLYKEPYPKVQFFELGWIWSLNKNEHGYYKYFLFEYNYNGHILWLER